MQSRCHKHTRKTDNRRKGWLSVFRDQNGTASLEFIILLPFFLFFLLIGFDFMRWTVAEFAIQDVAATAVHAIEKEGEANQQVMQAISDAMEQHHLHPDQWSFSAQPSDREWTLLFQSQIPFNSFSLMGMKVSVPAAAKRTICCNDREDRSGRHSFDDAQGRWDHDPLEDS